MHILLVDLIIGDHSIPYASSIKQQLESKDAVSGVDFLTLAGNDRVNIENYFTQNSVYFIQHDYADATPGYFDPIVGSFHKMIEFIRQRSYDVVHILQIDNVLIESSIALESTDDLPPIVAQVNGAFFGQKRSKWLSDIYKPLSKMLSSPLRSMLKPALIRSKSKRLANEVSLYNCMRDNLFQHLLVHTDSAKEYFLDLGNQMTPISIVPEPPTVESPEISKQDARRKISIDQEETVLLFFGALRGEKGIYRLLRALKKYNGPKFTLVVAGPEASVTEDQLEKVNKESRPSMLIDIGYIYDSESYFIASDGVICPYSEGFGVERTSHVLQEAIKSRRPVICPSFGTFKHRLKNYDLGIDYSPNTAEALNNAIRDFVNNPEQWYSSDDMRKFSSKHSFKRLSCSLIHIYQDLS